MPLNKPLLRRLANKLRRLRHEEHYDQGVVLEKTACGTTACIAGHTVLEAGYKLEWRGIAGEKLSYLDFCWVPDKHGKEHEVEILEAARKALGLTGKQADKLFLGVWPGDYQDRFNQAKRPSRVAADLLDAVIKTNGRVLTQKEKEEDAY